MSVRALFLCLCIGNSFLVFEAKPTQDNAFDKIAKIDARFKETSSPGHKVDMILPPMGQVGFKAVELWPGAVIPYTISQELKQKKGFVKILLAAMDEWQQKTCIQFKQRKSEYNYVHFIDGHGCQSDVGIQRRGKQTVSLGTNCDSHSIVAHELGHTIGLYHEQNRPDRNKYIKVLWDNIMPVYHFAYRIKHGWHPQSLKTPYDYYSIMHYGNQDFRRSSKNGENVTMKAYNKDITSFGGRIVSGLDAMKVRRMYQCKDYPWFPQDFYWTYNNYVPAGYTCLQINDPRDNRIIWNKNKLCYYGRGKRPLPIVWSYQGPVAHMNCEKIRYGGKPSGKSWDNNYLCLPKYAPFKFQWRNGRLTRAERRNCLKINEPSDRSWTRVTHYLCATERETDKIDGKWLEWSEWYSCSLECGTGVQYRQRKCTQPANGGKICVGESRQARPCNTQACNALPSFPKDFFFVHLDSFAIPEDGICLRTYDLMNYYDSRGFYFCSSNSKADPDLRWSPWGPVQGMRCTKIYNPKEYSGWDKNYLCVPPTSPYKFKWSLNGPIPNMACMRWFAKQGQNGWDKTYLCDEKH